MRFSTVSTVALLASLAVAAPLSNYDYDDDIIDDECDAGGDEALHLPTTTSSAMLSSSSSTASSSFTLLTPSAIGSIIPLSHTASPTPTASPSSSAAASPSAIPSASPSAAASSSAAAAAIPTTISGNRGSVYVHNKCEFEISLTPVGTASGDLITVKPNDIWNEQYQLTSGGGTGSVLKVYKDDPANITQVEYSWQNDGSVWYDISILNGDPFVGIYNAILPQDDTCQQVICDTAPVPCPAAYTESWQGKNYECPSTTNLIYQVCQ